MVWHVYTQDGPAEDSVESANADDRGIFRFADLPPDLLPQRATRFRRRRSVLISWHEMGLG